MIIHKKYYWVKYILDKDINNIIERRPLDELVNDWFCSSKSSDFLRLSIIGKYYFDLILKDYYDFEIPQCKNNYLTALYHLHIGKKLYVPFYIVADKPVNILRIYDKPTATLITLSGGIKDYLDK
jgi:hypothetical protein